MRPLAKLRGILHILLSESGMGGARFRQRKLSTKQTLQILREDQIDSVIDDDAQRNIPKVDTGVEKGEEIVSFVFFAPCLCLYLVHVMHKSRDRS